MKTPRMAVFGLSLLAVLAAVCLPAAADTNYVWTNGLHIAPFDSWDNAATTIQAAINAAVGPTNVVLVTNGWYALGAEIGLNRPITVRSVNGAEPTIVYRTGPANHRIFRITDSAAVLDGFTISNGVANAGGVENAGGGVLIQTNGTVKNCLITKNTCGLYGGGVAFATNGVLRNCTVTRNQAGYYGGGVALDCYGQGGGPAGNGLVENCIISFNNVGGVYMRGLGDVRSCVIYGNSRGQGGSGIMSDYPGVAGPQASGSPHHVENCTIARNLIQAPESGCSIYCWATWANYHSNNVVFGNTAASAGTELSRWVGGSDGLSPHLSGRGWYHSFSLFPYYTNWSTSGTGNLMEHDPQFRDAANGDFRLRPGSPCIDAGSNNAWMATATDLAGNPRITNGVVDMGAYEYVPGALDCNLVLTNSAELQVFTNQLAMFKGYAAGTNLSGLTYQWDFENDGSYDTTGETVTKTYAPGIYTVKLRVTNAGSEESICIRTNYLKVGPPNMYVANSGGSHTWPFDTWAKAGTNIQEMINIGVNGSTIWFADGLYELPKTVNIVSNGVVLKSMGGYKRCTLSGRKAIMCLSVSNPRAVIDGFTIQYGQGGTAGGIETSAMEPGEVHMTPGVQILNCHFNKCRGSEGAATLRTHTLVRNCLFTENAGSDVAGAVWCGCYIGLNNCTIANNTNTYGAVYGYLASGLQGANWSYPHGERNVIIYGNTWTGPTPYVDQFEVYVHAKIEHSCSISTGECQNGAVTFRWHDRGIGNISNQAPMFASSGEGNYHLGPLSPCIDTGTNVGWAVAAAATDIDGNPRRVRTFVDMGAFESGPRGAVLFLR